jgi:hypothetical protein
LSTTSPAGAFTTLIGWPDLTTSIGGDDTRRGCSIRFEPIPAATTDVTPDTTAADSGPAYGLDDGSRPPGHAEASSAIQITMTK